MSHTTYIDSYLNNWGLILSGAFSQAPQLCDTFFVQNTVYTTMIQSAMIQLAVPWGILAISTHSFQNLLRPTKHGLLPSPHLHVIFLAGLPLPISLFPILSQKEVQSVSMEETSFQALLPKQE